MNNPLANTDPTGLDCCSHPQVPPGLIGGDEFDMMGIPAGPPTLIGFISTTEIFIDPDTGALSIIPIGANAIYDPGTSAGADFVDAVNNGSSSWWGAFAKNLFSWKNFTDEFKHGGCVGVFVDAASEGGILPDLPAGHGVEDAVTDASKMAAATYAVNQGLVVPLRSSVVRGILDLGETSASGLVLADTYAKIGAGGLAEYNAIKNGDCH